MSCDKNLRSSFQDVREAELLRIRERRKQYLKPRLPTLKCDKESPTPTGLVQEGSHQAQAENAGDQKTTPLTGLALSGGGIRSACFNLGLVEALDAQAVSPDQCAGNGTAVPNPKDDVRYLELFDYLSTVSGGSYVAGHLAMTASKPSGQEFDGAPPDTRLGELPFDTNSVPQWSWAVGVWFLGFAFQVVKTGALLVGFLGLIAWIFRTCDAPDLMRFCDAIGLTTDIRRGFVPFWLMLGVTFISFLLRRRPRRGTIWVTISLVLLIAYSTLTFNIHVYGYRTPFTFHILSSVIPFSFGFFLVMLSETRHFLKTRTFWIAALVVGLLLIMFNAVPAALQFCDSIGLDSTVRQNLTPFWILMGIILTGFGLWQSRQTVLCHSQWRNLSVASGAVLSIVAVYSIAIFLSETMGYPAPLESHLVFSVTPFLISMALIILSKRHLPPELPGRYESPKWIYILPLLTALFCFAGLVTTGDIDVGTQTVGVGVQTTREFSKLLAQWGQRIFMTATAALGLTSLVFVRWRDLLRSTHHMAEHTTDSRWRPIFQVIIFLCSYGLLLLLSFVLYGAVARENVSGFNDSRDKLASPFLANGDERSEPFSLAFQRTDFAEWDVAWERIAHDANPANWDSPWHSLAVALLQARTNPEDSTSTPDKDTPYSFANELSIAHQILNLEAKPWLARFTPNERPWLAASLEAWLPVALLYELKLDLLEIQKAVAAQISTHLLGDKNLYLKVRHVPESAAAVTKPQPTVTPTTEKLSPRDQYLRTAQHLAGLPGDSEELQAAIRRNNRRALRLYLGDLVRDGDAKTKEVFSSVVWYEDQWARMRIIAIAALVWLFCVLIDRDANQFSLHAFYHDHIREKWLRRHQGTDGTGWLFENQEGEYRSGPPRLDRIPGNAPPKDRGDRQTSLRRAPFLLINATISEGSRSLGNDPNLCLNIFTFSSIAAGSQATDYWLEEQNEKFVRKNLLDISQIVAASGAFLSPGQVANPTLAAIFHVLNIQTGWWVSDPAIHENIRGRLHFHLWQSLGVDWKDDNHYLLTDGAHVENLGLKVLLDRRCSLIVASDCSQESDLGHPFCALIEVLRQARLDGIRVGPFLSSRGYRHWLQTDELDEATLQKQATGCLRPQWQGLDLVTPPASAKKAKKPKPAPGDAAPSLNGTTDTLHESPPSDTSRLAQEHFLFAHLQYPARGSEKAKEGLLIYLRPTLTGDEGESLVRPGFAGALFPNDPPLDQFYNVARMNSYRLLGRHIGHELTQNTEFREAMERIVRGESAVPTRPHPRAYNGIACLDCLRGGNKRCRAHVDSAFRTSTAP